MSVHLNDREFEISLKLLIVVLVLIMLITAALVFSAFQLRTAVNNGQAALDQGAQQRQVLVDQGDRLNSLVEQVKSCTDPQGECAQDSAKSTANIAASIIVCTKDPLVITKADALDCVARVALTGPRGG